MRVNGVRNGITDFKRHIEQQTENHRTLSQFLQSINVGIEWFESTFNAVEDNQEILCAQLKEAKKRILIFNEALRNLTLEQTCRQSLEIRLSCILQLINSEISVLEVKKRHDSIERNRNLSDEVKALFDHPQAKACLQKTLSKIKTFYQKEHGYRSPSCYVAYAWPIKDEVDEKKTENFSKEYWVQPFLEGLRDQLVLAGVIVMLDVRSNPHGHPITQYLQEIDNVDFVVVAGSRSLLEKFLYRPGSNIGAELVKINRRQQRDPDSILPIVLIGDIAESLPAEYEKMSNVKNWQEQSYVTNLRELIRRIYNASPDNDDYKQLWSEFYREYPQFVNFQFAAQGRMDSGSAKSSLTTLSAETDLYANHFNTNSAYWGVPEFDEEVTFVGRRAEQQEYINSLSAEKPLVVYGIHGVGKSEIARKIVRDCSCRESNRFTHGFWFNATSEDLLVSALNNVSEHIMKQINLKYTPQVSLKKAFENFAGALKKISMIRRGSTKAATQVLIVLDDVPNEGFLKGKIQALKDAGVFILITTNNEKWGNTFNSRVLDCFQPGEANEFVLSNAVIEIVQIDEAQINRFCIHFDRHPLRLFVAIKAINILGVGFDRYIEIISKTPFAADLRANADYRVNNYQHQNFLNAIKYSISRMCKKQPRAFEVIAMCSLFDVMKLPYAFVVRCASMHGFLDELEVLEILSLMREYSFLRLVKLNVYYAMHPSIQSAVRHLLAVSKNFDLIRVVVSFFNQLLPYNVESNAEYQDNFFGIGVDIFLVHAHSVVESCVKIVFSPDNIEGKGYAENIDTDLQERFLELIVKLGIFTFLRKGDYLTALRDLTRAMSLIEPLYERNQQLILPHYVKLLRYLFDTCVYTANFEEALRYFAKFQKILDGHDELLHHKIRMLCDVGYLYLNLGEYQKSLDVLLGCDIPDDRSTVSFDGEGKFSLRGHRDEAVGLCYLLQGDSAGALNHLCSARDEFIALDIENYPKLAEAFFCLGVAYLFLWVDNPDQYQFIDAETNFLRCVDIQTKKWEQHPDIAEGQTWMGWAYYYSENYEQAKEYAMRAFEFYTKHEKGSYRKSISCYVLLAHIYEQLDFTKVSEYWEKACKELNCHSEQAYGQSFVNGEMPILDWSRVSIKELADANIIDFYQSNLLSVERLYGKNHHETAFHYFRLGVANQEAGYYQNALYYFTRSHQTLAKKKNTYKFNNLNKNLQLLEQKIVAITELTEYRITASL